MKIRITTLKRMYRELGATAMARKLNISRTHLYTLLRRHKIKLNNLSGTKVEIIDDGEE